MQCNTMQCNAMQCNAMQCNAMQCNAMQYAYNAMQCNAMQCNAMQCNAMQCNAMQCNAMQYAYNAMQCNAVQYIAMRLIESVFFRSPNKGFWACLGDLPPDMPRQPETWVSLCNFLLKLCGILRSSAILESDSPQNNNRKDNSIQSP